MKHLLPLIFSQAFFKKIFAIVCLITLFYVFRGFLGLFLITFIFAYLSLEVAEFLRAKIIFQKEKNPNKFWKFFEKYLSTNILVTIIYILFILMVIWLFASILPQIIKEIEIFIKKIPEMTRQMEGLLQSFENTSGIHLWSQNLINDLTKKFDFQTTGQELLKYLQNTSGALLQFFLGIVMSYIFVLDRNDVFGFFARMKRGNFAFLYHEFKYFGEKIVNSFGKVFKAQGIIAFVNAILTTIGLLVIGFLFPAGHFPFIFTLSLIVFIFGFIPVFGTFLSGLPIVIIGYGIEGGGIQIVMAIIVMICIIHAIEAYILNPKIVSSYMHFPVFITFATLIVAEHMFGMIGLLIGVPILAIIISVGSDLNNYISRLKKEYYASKKSCECQPISEK